MGHINQQANQSIIVDNLLAIKLRFFDVCQTQHLIALLQLLANILRSQHPEICRNFEFASRASHAPIARGKQQQQGQGDTHLPVARRTYLVLRSSSPQSRSQKKPQNWATN